MSNDEKSEESKIRELIDRWAQASRVKDLDGIMACYAPDIVAFDAIAQLQFKGMDAYRKHWQYCFGFMESDMIFDIHELSIAVGSDVAFCHYLAVCGGTTPDGTDQSGWVRGTICLRKIGGQWLTVHEHFSLPFDPKTMKVLADLKP